MIAVNLRHLSARWRKQYAASGLCLLGLLASASGGIRDARWNVLDYAALGDGQTDNTVFFQRVLDEAHRAGGGIVLVPGGQYRIGGGLVIPAGVTLQGTYRQAPSGTRSKEWGAEGSTLFAGGGRGAPEAPPLVRLSGSGATLTGFLIAYPEVSADEIPVAYPPTVVIEQSDTVIENCCIVNGYEGVRIRGAGRYLVRNVHGFSARGGIRVEDGRRGGRIENCRFSPEGYCSDGNGAYARWALENGVGFEFAGMEELHVSGLFCSGYRTGYHFGQPKAGPCAGSFVGIATEGCARPVLVTQSSDGGLLISNARLTALGNSKDSACVEVAADCSGRISLVNSVLGGSSTRLVWMRSSKTQLIVSACHFLVWDDEETPAVQIDAGRAIIQGCAFAKGACHVAIADKTEAVSLVGNQAPMGFRVRNKAGARTQSVANEEAGPR